MTAPSPASSAQPGWRGTDPDGGTWVLTPRKDSLPWIEVLVSNGRAHYRSQEEAEAAGLVPLEARRDPNESGLPSWQEELIKAAADVVIGVLCPGGRVIETPDGTRLVLTRADAVPAPLDLNAEVEQAIAEELDASLDLSDEQREDATDAIMNRLRGFEPAPLDPGNPEHLRRHADNHQRFCAALLKMPYEVAETARTVAPWDFRREADRLDRERAEAEQDAADRALIEGAIREAIPAIGARTYEQAEKYEAVAEAVLRAERARQEAGQ